MSCQVRMFGDVDTLLCDGAHHPAHTFTASWAADRHTDEVSDE